MHNLIGLDFETYGATDLPTHGLARYLACETFKPIMARVIEPVGRSYVRRSFDFVLKNYEYERHLLAETLENRTIVAHNAPFEQGVLRTMGLDYPAERFIDSAVVARAAGAGGKLEVAGPQLLGVDKVEAGKHLMRLFSIPKDGQREFDPQVVHDNPAEWVEYGDYCAVDAELGLHIVEEYLGVLTDNELHYMAITMRMNDTGWKVDVGLVEEMQRRYLENQEAALWKFRTQCNAADLNLNSLKQLKEWCLDRGIKANSFAEKNVEKLLAAVEKKIATMHEEDTQWHPYHDVRDLLQTKRILGGSSLKKLQVILDTQVDGRVLDQYLHIGAGQTWRTTGRSIQMQNLKRLSEVGDMAELEDEDSEWDNDKLAENIRQLFTATDPRGYLLVGDFAAVENRGLAWFAGAEWKLDAFRQGLDLYKVAAVKQFNLATIDMVTKDQRTFGKVGELSCGYQAGPVAVKDFAAGMGITLTEGEASKLVYDWRDSNPEKVALWAKLDEMLHDVVENGSGTRQYFIPNTGGWTVELMPTTTPQSLLDLHPNAQSVKLLVADQRGDTYLRRFFHGCYVRGRNIGYYKPTSLKSGDLWKNNFVNPKTKQLQFYQIYGGKLAGILTQSMCREIFFDRLMKTDDWVSVSTGLKLVGQFHDEIVLDWAPSNGDLLRAVRQFREIMSTTDVPNFPLAAEIKWDYRYTK